MPTDPWGQCRSKHNPLEVGQSPSGGGHAGPGPRGGLAHGGIWACATQSTNCHLLETMQASPPVATIWGAVDRGELRLSPP